MDIFIVVFFYKILAKYSPFRTKLQHLKKNYRGSMPRTPLANAWLRYAVHGALRHTNTPIFKNMLNPPIGGHMISTCTLFFMVSMTQLHFRFVLSHYMNILLILLRFNSCCQNKLISVSVSMKS